MLFSFARSIKQFGNDQKKKLNQTKSSITFNTVKKPSEQAYGKVLAYFVLSFCGLQIIKELIQLLGKRLRYFADITNYLEWGIIACTVGYMAKFIFGTNYSNQTQFQLGIICIFLGWINVMLFLQRLPTFALLMVMFLKVIRTLILVLLAFGVVFVAFALTFYQLFVKGQEFMSFSRSLMKTFVMFVGEIEYEDNLTDSLNSKDSVSGFPVIPYPTLSYILMFVFLVVISIGLMNLLVSITGITSHINCLIAQSLF